MNTADFRARAEAKRLFFAFYSKRAMPVPDHYRSFMGGGEVIQVQHGGTCLEARLWGQGPTVLLAHGLFGAGGAFKAMTPRLVEAGYRVVVFDAPAHGTSPGSFVHADEVADAMLSIDVSVGPLFAVVGHSFGAIWALHARQMGLRISRLVCISMPANPEIVLDWFCREVQPSPQVRAHLTRLIECFDGPDVWHKYSPVRMVTEVDLPGLVVHDRGDPIADPASTERLAQAWPSSRMCWTERLGHFRTLDSPAVSREIAAFLQ